jgi:NADPH-dependent F420 reductase
VSRTEYKLDRSQMTGVGRVSHTIAIIGGTGPEGMGLALRWARAGEQVLIGSRDAQRARDAAANITLRAGGTASVRGMENAEAVRTSQIVVLTVPFSGQAALLKNLKLSFKPGAILIDATVPLATAVGGVPSRTLTVWQGSAAEQAAELVPKGVAVVGAFHNIPAGALSSENPVDCDAIICTDDEDARKVASELAEEIPGVRAINGGRLENSRIVEQITALFITINQRYKVHGVGLRLTGLPIAGPQS